MYIKISALKTDWDKMGPDDLIEKAKESANTITDKISEFKDNLIGDESKAIMDEFNDAGVNKALEWVHLI